MKQLSLILLMYFSLGMTTLDSTNMKSKDFKMTVPNKIEMEQEVKKMEITSIKASKLNDEASTTLVYLDSLNNALKNPKALRQYKRDLKN